MKIEIIKTTTSFFSELIEINIKKLNIKLDEIIKTYIIHLLNNKVRAEKTKNNALGVELLKALQNKDKSKKFTMLREIGDTALYEAGFFYSQLIRSNIAQSYYKDIGQSAYMRLSYEQVKTRNLFAELANKFSELLDLLMEISEKENNSNSDLIDLYEKWLFTKNKNITKRLYISGIIPIDWK